METCLVLGAGATLANALHFRAERRKSSRPPLDTTFFETVEARKIALSLPLKSYFENYIGIDPVATTLREYRMEEIFKDVSYDFRENSGDKAALDAYLDLVDLYLRVLRETTNWLCADTRTGGPVGRLIAEAAKTSDKVTILTFNHDLVIENEISRRASLRPRWCIDKGYGTISSSLNPLVPVGGSAKTFHYHDQAPLHEDRPIVVLKPHGSLNWNVRINSTRPTARFLEKGGGTSPLQLVTRRQIGQRSTFIRSGGSGGRTEWTMWPIIVPPVYAKQALRPKSVKMVWEDAGKAIRGADRILFFGYSLPELDVEAEKLFERGLLRNDDVRWLDVVNPSPATAARFASVAPTKSVRWYPSLTRFIEDSGF
ncbi:MAG: hypothetical protein WBM00_12785 [Solirubrobacterales bacterium]